MADTEQKIVRLPGTPKRAVKRGDDKLAADIRRAYEALIRRIEAARNVGLEVHVSLDTADTVCGGKVRGRQITVTRKL